MPLPWAGMISHWFDINDLVKGARHVKTDAKILFHGFVGQFLGSSHRWEEQENSILFLYSNTFSEGTTSSTLTSLSRPMWAKDSVTCAF